MNLLIASTEHSTLAELDQHQMPWFGLHSSEEIQKHHLINKSMLMLIIHVIYSVVRVSVYSHVELKDPLFAVGVQ